MSLVAVVVTLAAPANGSARTPIIELAGPTRANVGQPVTLTLRVTGASDVAGFETQLLYDTSAAEFASVDYRRSGLKQLRGAFRQLGPVELGDGIAFGSYACPTRGCSPRGVARVGRGSTGGVFLARVRLYVNRPGDVEFRLTGTRLVARDGSRVPATGGERVLTVDVGRSGATHEAARALRTQRLSGTQSRASDLTGDGRLSEQDVTEAELEWATARSDDVVCAASGTAGAVNRDSCVDVADVQTLAATVAGELPETISTETNATLAVNSAGDSSDTSPGDGICRTSVGTCTLRAAIQEANAQGGANDIAFAIAGTGVHTIQLGSALPTLSDTSGPTTIDGYTQLGASPNTHAYAMNAQLRIEVRGTGSAGVDALRISSPNNVITGIAFYNLRRTLWLHGPSTTGNVIRGVFIGTNAAGTFASTQYTLSAIGITLENGAANNRIGDTSLAARNVISGNGRHGLACYAATNNFIYNNVVGLSPLGDRRLMNLKIGLDFNSQCANNTIGGTGPLQRNIIAGNGDPAASSDFTAGVEISHGPSNIGNQIVGNCFGTDVTCTTAGSWTHNAYYGIHIEDTPKDTVVSNNVIVNNSKGGIKIENDATTGTRFTNNLVGVLPDGRPFRNLVFGVLVANRTTENRIGPGNVIANNPVGIWVRDPSTRFNTISRNSIFANGGLGIDLDPTGVNANDVNDADSGTNNMLNFPEIVGATASAVSGRACAGCIVEVFIAEPDPSGHGEGKTFVGTATADSTGGFSAAVSGVGSGQRVTATATDSLRNTSEFARNVTVVASDTTAPLAPSLELAQSGDGRVRLEWAPPTFDGGAAVTAYRIYRGVSGAESFLTQVGSIDNFTDTTAANGTTYWYRVSAVNSVGEGLLSNGFSATPGAVVVSDRFERTVASGFGAADSGAAWSVNSTSMTKVEDGNGVIYGFTHGNQDVHAWAPTAAADVELLGVVRLGPTNPVGANYQARVVARAQSDARNGYIARITHTTTGAAQWGLSRIDNAGGTGSVALASGTLTSSGAAGSVWLVRLRVEGASIRVRYWLRGTTEPTAWTAAVSDAYWTSGRASVGALVGGAISSPFPVVGFDSFTAVNA